MMTFKSMAHVRLLQSTRFSEDFRLCRWHRGLGNVEQADAEPRQIRGHLCTTSRRQHQLPTAAIPIVGMPITPARSVGDLDLTQTCQCRCTSNERCAVLRSSPSIASDRRALPTATFQILVVALVHSRLDYGNAVLVSGLPGTPFRVRAQREGTTHLSSATARLHLWCVGDTALAARPRTRAVQNRGANVQSASRQRAAISGTSCRRCWLARSASSAVRKYQHPRCAALKLSTAGTFRLPQLNSGTVCQRPSSHRHHCRLSAVNKKLNFFNFHILTWFYRYSGLCSNVRYLGHYKHVCLLYLLYVFIIKFYDIF